VLGLWEHEEKKLKESPTPKSQNSGKSEGGERKKEKKKKKGEKRAEETGRRRTHAISRHQRPGWRQNRFFVTENYSKRGFALQVGIEPALTFSSRVLFNIW
jgi:hypothetical protein